MLNAGLVPLKFQHDVFLYLAFFSFYVRPCENNNMDTKNIVILALVIGLGIPCGIIFVVVTMIYEGCYRAPEGDGPRPAGGEDNVDE